MKPDVFFENFELLADAPNGVQKLRELILQLAVMGKLVPQNPNDEPASVLIEKTKNEKRKLEKEGKIKNSKSLPPIEKNEIPFVLPSSWQWERLGKICLQITDGSHSSPPSVSKGYPYITVKDITDDKIDFTNCKFITEESYRKLKHNGCEPEIWDVLFSKDGTVGKVAVINFEKEFVVLSSLAILRPKIDALFPFFLKYMLKARPIIDQAVEMKSGSALKRIILAKINLLKVPIPPLAEQKRIVSKVDELMTLCDKLEARRQKKQEIQSKLNSAALDRMLSAENQEEFEQHWQRICENFDLLYDNPENVEKLRQGILQLAVQGRLVPQNPEDEPASALIEKIKAKKRQLVKVRKIKNSKVSTQMDSQEIPYELPDKWEWIRIEDITDIGTGSTPLKSKSEYYEDGSIPWITSSLTSLNYIDKAETYITETAVNECNLKIYPSGTLLVALYGQGKTRGQVSELRMEATINQACASIVFIENFENIKQYVKVFFEQKYEELRALAAGGAQPNLNVGKIKETLIPLPPFAEQKRIVEKVEQLMGLCDELEAKLRKEREDSEKLMVAVVKGLLEGSATEKLELEEPIPLQTAAIKLK